MDPDLPLRVAAIEHLRALSAAYEDFVPRDRLLENLEVGPVRLPLFNPQAGIHRPRVFRGAAALTIVTAAPKPGREHEYDDAFDEATGVFRYSYRRGAIDGPDNRALRSAVEQQVPLIYLMGVAPGRYAVAAPVFLLDDAPTERCVIGQVGSRITDLGADGIRSDIDVRRYETREVRQRLHQHRFRVEVMRAYRSRCTICALRESSLLQAAHIIEDGHERGVASVRNGLALCAIHHLAYDRQVLGIDPDGVVHIADRLLREIDGPMLKMGLQGFHGEAIALPRRPADRPDPQRLAMRFDAFTRAA